MMLRSLFAGAALLALTLAAHAQSAPKKFLSTASTNSNNVWVGQTVLRTLVPVNTTATIYYLKLYNKATAPVCGTDVPLWTIPVPANLAPLPISNAVGTLFGLGLGFCLTGGIADNDVAVAAAGVAINFGVSSK